MDWRLASRLLWRRTLVQKTAAPRLASRVISRSPLQSRARSGSAWISSCQHSKTLLPIAILILGSPGIPKRLPKGFFQNYDQYMMLLSSLMTT